MVTPNPTCFKLFMHWMRLAFSLAEASAGSSIAARMAMMAMTTSSSINVKPRVTFEGKIFIHQTPSIKIVIVAEVLHLYVRRLPQFHMAVTIQEVYVFQFVSHRMAGAAKRGYAGAGAGKTVREDGPLRH